MGSVIGHFRRYLLRRLLAVIPMALPVSAPVIPYNAVDKRVGNLVDRVFGVSMPGLGIMVVLDWYRDVYDRERLHRSLGYREPAEVAMGA